MYDSQAIIGQLSIFQRQNSNIWLFSLIKTDIFDLWSTSCVNTRH